MKIDFFVLYNTIDTFGWNKAVALVRHGYEEDTINGLECQLALDKMKAMFKHQWRQGIDNVGSWEHYFYNNAFDMGKPFSLERGLENSYHAHCIATSNKSAQTWETCGKRAIEVYTVLGENPECVMQAEEF